MLLTETHFRAKDTYKLKVTRWRKIFIQMTRKQDSQYSSDKTDFKTKAIEVTQWL